MHNVKYNYFWWLIIFLNYSGTAEKEIEMKQNEVYGIHTRPLWQVQRITMELTRIMLMMMLDNDKINTELYVIDKLWLPRIYRSYTTFALGLRPRAQGGIWMFICLIVYLFICLISWPWLVSVIRLFTFSYLSWSSR